VHEPLLVRTVHTLEPEREERALEALLVVGGDGVLTPTPEVLNHLVVLLESIHLGVGGLIADAWYLF
jgi:hypothetical protein